MRRITIVENLTLDGVMQAPGGENEDRRGGFEHGGWAQPYNDEVMGRELGGGMGTTALLFGRRTYQIMYDYWPTAPQPNPFTDVLNNAQKYVASRTMQEPLPWQNSTLLAGDAAKSVAKLKQESGSDLVVLGSGELVRTLIAHDLVDEYKLLIFPLVLGTGIRLFDGNGARAKLKLTHSVPTTTGVLIATYTPA
jgi:dihydrofolate reductase